MGEAAFERHAKIPLCLNLDLYYKCTVSSASAIQALALKLPQRSRLKLAGELLRSLTAAATPDEALEEALKREMELEIGKVQPLSEATFWKSIVRYHSPAPACPWTRS